MGRKDKFNGELIQESLDSGSIQAILLKKFDERCQRPALSRIFSSNFVYLAAACAVMLFSRIDEVKIDGEGANHIDSCIQFACFYNLRDLLI